MAKLPPALILCASLVENPANLGALCRTAEVLGLDGLVLADLALAKDWDFRKLAVSAQQWLPLSACPADRLPNWISQQQAAGHPVIALTLGAQTTPLLQTSLPPRCILLLGRELTGIPPALADCCDAKVSIPQWGKVQSLNVATAGAIAAYEHRRQWPIP
jgi:tRNA G18 (ribose-2'-O)-methylase SpoU